MNRPLTHQQQAVYSFIRDRIVSRGYGPTVREIGEHMNIKSPNGVMCHLRALERKGMLTRTANKSRAIELTEPISALMGGSLPIEGHVAGGRCTPQRASEAVFELSQLTGKERFVLDVKDDSLQAADIKTGDLLIVQRGRAVNSGQIAVVVSPEPVWRVCYLSRESDGFRLQSINRSDPSTVLDSVEVIGTVVGLVRRMPMAPVNSGAL